MSALDHPEGVVWSLSVTFWRDARGVWTAGACVRGRAYAAEGATDFEAYKGLLTEIRKGRS